LLFFAPMLLLIAVAACCCILLIGVAGALWLSIRRERDQPQPQEAVTKSFAEAMQLARKAQHPRMDLAAGIAAGTAAAQQHVGATRRRGLSLDPAAEADASLVAAKIPGRTDWAFYNGKPGDLSDPDMRRAPAGGVRRPLGTVSLPEPR
jgi:hypothetical protein